MSTAELNTDNDVVMNYKYKHIKHYVNSKNTTSLVGRCTNLGYGSSQEGPVFSWKDPDNVAIEDAILSEWEKTILVRKIGSYPESYIDGEIIATTSDELENKNYYLNHSFVDTTQQQGYTYYYKLFSKSKNGAWNNLIQNQFTNGTGLNWYQVQQYVRAGRGQELFPVGTVFYVNHPQYTHQDGTGIIFRVVGHDKIPTTNQNLTHSMCLEMAQVLFSTQYDAPQLQYYYTNDTTAQAGKIYYTYQNNTYTELTYGTDYEIGDNIPVSSWYQKNINQARISYGSNNPKQNNLIQWANSEGSARTWFTKQTIWDQCGSVLFNKNGFMKYLDEDFKNVIQNANITRNISTLQGGGSITFSAKFFPLSQTQVFGSSNENVQLTYYTQGRNTIKHTMDSESSVVWWLGSPRVADTYYVYIVGTDGTLNGGNAYYTVGVSLACIIA